MQKLDEETRYFDYIHQYREKIWIKISLNFEENYRKHRLCGEREGGT